MALARCPVCGALDYGCAHRMRGGGPGLQIIIPRGNTVKHVLTEDTYVNETWDRVVPGTSQEAAYTLGGRGSEIDLDLAIKLGLAQPVEPVDESSDTVVHEASRWDEPMYRRPSTAAVTVTAPVAGVVSFGTTDDDDDDDDEPASTATPGMTEEMDDEDDDEPPPSHRERRVPRSRR